MASDLALSVGQAFVTSERRHHRSSMATQVPDGELLAGRGACAVIADSPWRNAIARQAADLAVRGFLADYFSTPLDWNVKHAATRVLRALNGWCYSQSRFVSGGSYVSAFSGLILLEDQGHLFHAGDTLVFRLRGAEFEQLTRDHVTDLGGYRYPSRALGMDASLDIDYLNLPLAQGDLFLFTTQAMRGTLSPSDYVQLISQDASDLDGACERLAARAVEMASLRGYGAEALCFQLVRIDRLGSSVASASRGVLGDGLEPPGELEVGDELDGYWVEEVLARTDRVRVYRVRDAASGERLLLKAPSPQLSERSGYLRHFVYQRDLVKRLRSPFVNRLVEFKRPPTRYYYLMRFVEGELLGDWIRGHVGAGLEQRLDIARQLTKAVGALHRREVIHQGVHPDAFIVDQHGQVVLIDFSSCCARDTDATAAVALAREVGLSAFSAPEYALDGEVGRRSDQFSLAALIYWLLSYSDASERGMKARLGLAQGSDRGGHLPFETPMQSLRTEMDLETLHYRPVSRLVPEVPESLDLALKRALSPRRELRFRRLSELLVALRAGHDPAPRAGGAWRQVRQVRQWQLIATVLLVILLVNWWLG